MPSAANSTSTGYSARIAPTRPKNAGATTSEMGEGPAPAAPEGAH